MLFKHSREKGQSLVLIALLVVAFAAILALVLDGGNAFAGRRKAQNAADAGALAGAQYMCKHQDAIGGANMATDYAITRNGATSVVASANLAEGTVIVTATVQQDTFFAGLLGIPQTDPNAVAIAKCDSPSVGIGSLPVAWSCRPPIGGLPGEDCTQKLGPCDAISEGGNNNGAPDDLACLYIFMDSVKVDYDVLCDIDPSDGISPGTIDCDINDDGVNDLMAGGDRSWLDFGNALQKYIGDPPVLAPPTLRVHDWWPGKPGGVTNAFASAESLLGKNIIIPVFNKVCDKTPTIVGPTNPESMGQCDANTPPDVIKPAGTGAFYFHIGSFAVFHVTCVVTKPSDSCPGQQAALAKGMIDKNNTNTIEGFFIKDNLPAFGGGGGPIDAYAFVVNLIK